MTEAENPGINSYDLAPYPRMSHFDTHPMHLCVLGTLMGLSPARPTSCRYLDIGCAMGSNILPMAMAYPESEFVGIDASERQVAMGNEDIAALGLSNVSLHVVDILELDLSEDGPLGKFDYIAAHGFYSWVPEHVADRLLAVIKRLLAPQGVAFVSYNVYPGWYQMEALREMMLYRVRDATSPQERIAQARQLLGFVANANPATESPFGIWANGFLEYVNLGDDFNTQERDAYLLHDQLEDHNNPAFFHQFNDHCVRHGLQYVCDAEIKQDFPQGLAEGTLDYLREMVHSPEDMQQYLDFARNRMFRRSLLTHADVPLSRVLRPERLATMRFASPIVPNKDDAEIHTRTPLTFTNHQQMEITTDHPLSKAALQCLATQWPRLFTLQELVECARRALTEPITNQDIAGLLVTLMQGFTSARNLIVIYADPPAYAPVLSERPIGSPSARYELRHGMVVTSQRHERVRLEPLEAAVLHLLDGTYSLDDLVKHFFPSVRNGAITFAEFDAAALDDAALSAHLKELIAKRLNSLCKAGMLVG